METFMHWRYTSRDGQLQLINMPLPGRETQSASITHAVSNKGAGQRYGRLAPFQLKTLNLISCCTCKPLPNSFVAWEG